MDIDKEIFEFPAGFSGIVPVFPLADAVFFPKTLIPLRVIENYYLQMIEETLEAEKIIGVFYAVPVAGGFTNISRIGTAGKIAHFDIGGDGAASIVLAGVERIAILEEIYDGDMLKAKVGVRPEPMPDVKNDSDVALVEKVIVWLRNTFYFENEDVEIPKPEGALLFQFRSLVNAFCMVANMSVEMKQRVLESDYLDEKLQIISPAIKNVLDCGEILKKIAGNAPPADKIGLN